MNNVEAQRRFNWEKEAESSLWMMVKKRRRVFVSGSVCFYSPCYNSCQRLTRMCPEGPNCSHLKQKWFNTFSPASSLQPRLSYSV